MELSANRQQRESSKLTLKAIAGGLAQLARALALQARGHRFDSDILHKFAGSRWQLSF